MQNEIFTHFTQLFQKLIDFDLEKQWKILSWNHDMYGTEFVSSIEHRQYPFYGVQFHPEKVVYEWIRHRNISHTPNAVMASQWFAKFFVDETRQNLNRFAGVDEENRYLIYNFQPTFTALVKSAFTQSYLFDGDSDYRRPLENKAKNDGSYHGGRPMMHAIFSLLPAIMFLYNYKN